MKNLLTGIVCCCFFCLACNSTPDKQNSRKEKYENSKLSLEDIEKKTPGDFLTITGNDKKNLVGQTVVRGKIHNNAKIVTYRDVNVKLFFYSKTGTLLQEDQEMIYETIAPGTTTSFKSKYFSPRGTDSIAMKILSAKY